MALLWYGNDVQPEKRPPGRPPTGVTPKRNIRVGDVWDEVEALVAAHGESMTDVIKRLLAAELKRLRRAAQ